MAEPLSRKEFFRRFLPRNGAPTPPAPARPAFRLRPPGALLPESEFLSRCTGCGDCAPACHQHSIVMREESPGRLLPSIDPRSRPCFLCDEPPCVEACGDGALLAVLDGRNVRGLAIRLGLAEVDAHRCLTARGESACRICVDACPLPEIAIRIAASGPLVDAETCTGCGLCVPRCPTEPASITIRPLASLAR